MTHNLGAMRELHLGLVLSTEDPESRGRVQVELLATGLVLWASCITNSAGGGYGVSCLPRVDEIVVLAFLGPDEDNGFVLGAVWSGDSAHPEDGRPIDEIYAITTPAGCKLIIDDGAGPQVKIETPSGAHITITDDGDGVITLERGSESIMLSDSTISISASTTIEIDAENVNVSASMVQVDASTSQFSGVVKCDSLVATSSISSPTYVPGAGNVW